MGLDLNYKANVLVNTENMEESVWLDWRRKGIGGSDAGAVLGISPYKTARDVYFEKIGREPDQKNNSGWVALEVGKRLEDLVAEIFAKKTGFKIWQEKVMFQHPKFPFMLADVDYFYETPSGERGILECKTANIYAKEKWEDDSVPYHYEMQCRHYMAVNNLSTAYIACLFSNSENDFLYRKIERDLDFEEAMIEEEEVFWTQHVQALEEPQLMGDGDIVLESLRKYQAYTPTKGEYMFDSESSADFESIMNLKAIKASHDKAARELDSQIKSLYAKFALELGNATKGKCVADDGSVFIITYHPSVRLGVNRENLELMRLNDKEAYDKYVTATESRTFQVKRGKK